MTDVIFIFGGTGETAQDVRDLYGNVVYSLSTIIVYIAGSDHPNVGGSSLFPDVRRFHGGALFPDLDVAAKHIKHAFQEKQLNRIRLKQALGNGVEIDIPLDEQEQYSIDRIALIGFSRGAVSAFATAKQLNELRIPMDIIADQPVPGQSTEKIPKAPYRKYRDLSQCHMIQRATTLLGRYHKDNGPLKNTFYRQMVAMFPTTTENHTYLLPLQSHLYTKQEHIKSELIRLGWIDATSQLSNSDERIRETYNAHDGYFTPPELSQKIYGANNCIMEVDPHYVATMTEQAKDYLILPYHHHPLNNDQLFAIVALGRADYSLRNDRRLFERVIANDERFISIINKTQNVCAYLIDVTQDNKSNKSNTIAQYSTDYKRSIFSLTHDYLCIDNPTLKDSKTFINHINRTQKIFEKQALEINRGRINNTTLHKALCLVTNTILHVTGLFLIFNMINLGVTGNYLFFNRTRSTQVMRNVKDEIIDITEANKKVGR